MRVADSDTHKGEVVFFNPGGPGSDAQSFIWSQIGSPTSIFHGMQDMDIVGKAWRDLLFFLFSNEPDSRSLALDIRATGQSNPVNCSADALNAIVNTYPGTYPQTEVSPSPSLGLRLDS
jgi:hypothetical protein